MPNLSAPGKLPSAPYSQTASVGSFPFQDPARLPADLNQMKNLYEDLRSFIVYEGANISDNSDPTIQLPLTQLRADSRRLQDEISVVTRNPGVQSSLTQQNLADMQASLTFLQRKVRLFETAGVVTDGVEGFTDGTAKHRASNSDLITFQDKIYAAILSLSGSGTTDVTVQARIKNLQNMYTYVTDTITKVNNGTMKEADIPIFKEDIDTVLPKLSDTSESLPPLIRPETRKKNGSKSSDGKYSLADLFYIKNKIRLAANGETEGGKKAAKAKDTKKRRDIADDDDTMLTASPFDSSSGMDDRAASVVKPGLDWKKRSSDICNQIRLRNLDPLDFGCIPEGSRVSEAYSWRGYAKMVCGRLTSTMDADLPTACGCPQSGWKGWALSY